MRAELVFDRLLLEPVGAIEETLVREVPGCTWAPRDRLWTAPCTWPTCLALRGIFGASLDIGPMLWQWAEGEAARNQHLLQLKDWDPADDEPLYPWQLVGREFLANAKVALLGDEMRLGKTPQAVAALEQLGDVALPALVVCPVGVQRSWCNEFERWYPGAHVVMVRGNATQRRRQIEQARDGVAVVAWSSLIHHSRLAAYGNIRLEPCSACDPESDRKPARCQRCPRDLNMVPWSTVIADEAHRAVNPRAQQTRALWAIGEKATYRWAMTGTPVVNHVGDLWAILHFLDPNAWTRRTQYLDRYCYTGWNTFGGLEVLGLHPERRDEFFAAFEPHHLRRTADEVDARWPGRLPQVVHPAARTVQLSRRERDAYDTFKRELILRLEDENLVAWNPLVEVTRLLQLAQGVVAAGEGENEFHIVGPSSKVDALVDTLEDVGDKPVVVFAVHKDLLHLAKAKLGDRAELLTGDVTGDERDRIVERFQLGEIPVLLVTFATGSEGLTLNRADTIILLERPWSLVQYEQGIHRVQGLGQRASHVLILDLVAENTVEERVVNALANKHDALDEVTCDRSRLRRWLD